MKRTPKTKKAPKKNAKRSEPVIPIVDEVVEMVFARLAEAKARAKVPARQKGKARAKEDPWADVADRGGLAGAVADLVLKELTRQSLRPERAKKPSAKRRRG